MNNRKRNLEGRKYEFRERRKFTKMRKSSSDRLFILERDVSLAEDLTGLRICAQELLSVKAKGQNGSKGYLHLQLKMIVRVSRP